MGQAARLHGLELRLETLAVRIHRLRQKAERMKGVEKIAGHAELAQLERRYKVLDERLRKLNGESSGFRRGFKNEVEKLTYDLSSAIEDLMMLIDSGYSAEKRLTRGH